MKKSILITLILLITTISNLIASEVLILTEDRAVEVGLRQNMDLLQSEIGMESTKRQSDNSWNNFMPTVTVETGITRSDTFLSESTSSDDPWDLSLYGGLYFTLGFDDFVDKDGDKLALQSKELQVETTRKSLEINIRKQFKYLLASKENLSLQENNINLARKRYEQAKINFNNGFISELSLLTAQNAVETLKPNYQDADTTYKQNMMSFLNTLGMDITQEVELEGSLDVEYISLDADILIATYLAKRLDVNTAKTNIDYQEVLLKSKKSSELLPYLTVTTYWNNSIDTVFDDPDWSDSFYLDLTIDIPITGFIPGTSDNLTIKKYQDYVEQYKLAYNDTVNSAKEDINSILMELEGAWANIETNRLTVELAQETYEMTEESFRKGTSEVLDVEDAQNDLLEVKQNLLLSKYTYLSGLLDLSYALNSDVKTIISE